MAPDVPDISEYALIGDSRTAALVSRAGSIDWLCLPQFDSSSVFNRLLDPWRGGHFTITPVHPFSTYRSYRGATAVLISEFSTQQGRVRVTDCMPVQSAHTKSTVLAPFRSVLRQIEGLEGRVPLQVTVKPRPKDGRVVPSFRPRSGVGYGMDVGSRLLLLASDIPLAIEPGELTARIEVAAGARHVLWLACSDEAPAVYPVIGQADPAIEETMQLWTRWTDACTYHGPYRRSVLRSALTLKLLTFAPSGAIVAAPTTSLPETIGGSRNYDYRYCWLRDASYTAQLFFRIGYPDEAAAFVRWLLHATALSYPALNVLYDVYGEVSVPEREVDWLQGYRNSQPVRIGNDAYRQLQLDEYGEVIDSLWMYLQAGYDFGSEMRDRLVRMADLVSEQWTLPDHGIWEMPTRCRHYLYSKVMCWAALDRADRIAEQLRLRADRARWRAARSAIRHTVLEDGYSEACQSFVQSLGSTEIDAAALRFLPVGFLQPDDPRAHSTIDAIRRHLAEGDLLYRYRDDGLPGQEGAFLACSFWLVEALAITGRQQEARQLFERLEKRANDVGLYSEEMDPATGQMLGNFPQALTHLSHIAAAVQLDQGRYIAPRTTP